MECSEKIEVKILHSTPLSVADKAIGTCWDVQKDETDRKRMYRVGRKFKHSSTIEHLRLVYTFKENHNCDKDAKHLTPLETTDIIQFFVNNPFSIIEAKTDFDYVVSTNLRVLLEAYDDGELYEELILDNLIPEEYKFLFTGLGDDDES